MALVLFLRGVNVGGRRTFRPSAVARGLRRYNVVNVGAAGTFVVRKAVSRAALRAEVERLLPFEAEMMICDGREVVRLATENPYGAEAKRAGVVRFVSVLPRAGCFRGSVPLTVPLISLPAKGKWLVRIVAVEKRFAFGEYRRDMKTIGYLGQLDRLLGGRVTTRNWNTMMAVVRVLKDE